MPDTGKKVTKADLAFIDAAIQLHRASLAPKGTGVSVDISDPACVTANDATVVVIQATHDYQIANSSLIGEDNVLLQRAKRLNLAPTVSLDKMIQARNKLANALGV